MSTAAIESTLSPAAAYVRMSTEHQQYSISNQMDVICEYAKRRGFRIVKQYSDKGKSGLDIQGRESLTQMIRDVQGGKQDFSCILVYDISRWGRFQDADESAYYEYICRQAGVAVHYCAEQFENDGSPTSTIVKSVKRAMAGEYSRELSSKTFQGSCRLVQLGFKQGGPAGYGLRRMLIDQNGHRKTMLKTGEAKSIQTDRVVLVRGPKEEVQTVRWIYEMFIDKGKNESEIAALLGARGIMTDRGRAWTKRTVRQVLTNEKYIGNCVYHRTSGKLKRKRVPNSSDKWIRANGVFERVVDPILFNRAREIILARSHKLTNEEMLEQLRALLIQHGRITVTLIDEANNLPTSGTFLRRFGSLVSAYRLAGYCPQANLGFIEVIRRLRKQRADIIATVVREINLRGASATWDDQTDLLCLNNELRISIVVCRHAKNSAGSSRWTVRLDPSLKPDITIAVRMDSTNACIRDYYLLPGIAMEWKDLLVAEENGIYLDAYRFDSLDYFLGMAERVTLQEAA